MDHEHRHEQQANGGLSKVKWVFILFAAVAAYFLIAEHRAHLTGYWPFLLLAACPLLHVFMLGGHGGHGGRRPDLTQQNERKLP